MSTGDVCREDGAVIIGIGSRCASVVVAVAVDAAQTSRRAYANLSNFNGKANRCQARLTITSCRPSVIEQSVVVAAAR